MRPLKCKEHAKSDVFCVTPLKRPIDAAGGVVFFDVYIRYSVVDYKITRA